MEGSQLSVSEKNLDQPAASKPYEIPPEMQPLIKYVDEFNQLPKNTEEWKKKREIITFINRAFKKEISYSPSQTGTVLGYMPLLLCNDEEIRRALLRRVLNALSGKLPDPMLFNVLSDMLAWAETGDNWITWSEMQGILSEDLNCFLSRVLPGALTDETAFETLMASRSLLGAMVQAKVTGLPKSFKDDLYQQVKKLYEGAKTSGWIECELALWDIYEYVKRLGSDEPTSQRTVRRAKAVGGASCYLLLATSKVLAAAGGATITFGVGALAALGAIPDLVDAAKKLKEATHTKEGKSKSQEIGRGLSRQLLIAAEVVAWGMREKHNDVVKEYCTDFGELTKLLTDTTLKRKILWPIIETLVDLLAVHPNETIRRQCALLLHFYYINKKNDGRPIQKMILIFLARCDGYSANEEIHGLLLRLLSTDSVHLQSNDYSENQLRSLSSILRYVHRKIPHPDITDAINNFLTEQSQCDRNKSHQDLYKQALQNNDKKVILPVIPNLLAMAYQERSRREVDGYDTLTQKNLTSKETKNEPMEDDFYDDSTNGYKSTSIQNSFF
ncbi:MAG: hypothetical protein ACX932_06940 [Gammaproteobacteria bacterium]